MLRRNVVKGLLSIVLIITMGLLFIIYNYNESSNEEVLINDYIEETSTHTKTTTSTTSTSKITNTTINTTKKNNYIFILEIPKIGLKKGIYNINDKNNTVDKNIQLLSSSNMPDLINGNVILASHNGNTKVSFFKNLEKLDNDDIAYIYYNGYKYTYSIYKKEIVDKIGNIKISKKSNVSNLILISCKNGTNDKQVVYIAKQINKEEY